MAFDLSPSQIAFFRENGYLAIPRFTSDEDVARLRASYDRIFAEHAGRELGDHFDLAGRDEEEGKESLPQILHPARYAPEMNDSELLRNTARVARQLLGPDADCEIAHAIFKPAGFGVETLWHQDAAYWSPEMR